MGGTGGNGGSQPGAKKMSSEGKERVDMALPKSLAPEPHGGRASGGGRRLYGPPSRPGCACERGTPETRERNRTGIGGGGPHAAHSTTRLCMCVCVRVHVASL